MKRVLLVLALILAAGEASATYPDLEAWAESPPSGWTLYCSETLDNNDTISGSSNNPSSSTTKQCPSGSSSGGTALTSNQSGWAMVTPASAGISTVGTGPAHVLRENQGDNTTGNISVIPSSFTVDASTTSYRLSFRHYRWFSSDAQAIVAPIGSKSRKIDEYNMGPEGTASYSGTNQCQQADIKDDNGTISSFFSSPGTDCELTSLTRVEGSALTIDDCKVPYGCRFEKAITWNHLTGVLTFETLSVQLGASGEVKRDRRLESCTPSVLPRPFKSDSNGMYINMNVNMTPQGGNGDTFVSMVVGAYRMNDATTNTWIGCSEEIEGVGCAGGSPPVASCDCSPTSGTATLAVGCTESSSGSPTSWSWDYYAAGGSPDGENSTSQNPTFNLGAGTWAIQLTATNGSGSSSPVECTGSPITVSAPASASYCCRRSP